MFARSRMRIASTVRVRFRHSPPVLERGMEEAKGRVDDARGHGAGRRSRYRPQPWTAGAVLIAAAAIVAAATFLAASAGGWAVLHPQTSPIMWPEANSLLLAAIGLLAVPGLVGRTRP
jgi:hypothetical protein